MLVIAFFHLRVRLKRYVTGTAGAGSLILEFATLSRLTGDDRFEKAAYKVNLQYFWVLDDSQTNLYD